MYATDPQIGNNGVFTSDISDHYSIFTVKQDVEPKILDKYFYKREITNRNISKFKNKFLRNICTVYVKRMMRAAN